MKYYIPKDNGISFTKKYDHTLRVKDVDHNFIVTRNTKGYIRLTFFTENDFDFLIKKNGDVVLDGGRWFTVNGFNSIDEAIQFYEKYTGESVKQYDWSKEYDIQKSDDSV